MARLLETQKKKVYSFPTPIKDDDDDGGGGGVSYLNNNSNILFLGDVKIP